MTGIGYNCTLCGRECEATAADLIDARDRLLAAGDLAANYSMEEIFRDYGRDVCPNHGRPSPAPGQLLTRLGNPIP